MATPPLTPVGITMATSLPMDLANGFAIFPTLGTSRAGTYSTSGQEPNDTVLDYFACTGGWDIVCYLNGGFYAGIIGPAFEVGLQMDGVIRTPGDYQNVGSMQTEISRDVQTGGMIIGIGFPIEFNLQFQSQDLGIEVNVRQNINVDLLQLLASLIIGNLGSEAFQKVAETLPAADSSWAFLDQTENIWVSAENPEFALNPVLTLPLNLTPLFMLLPEIGEVIESVLVTLKEIGADFSFGPLLGLGISLQGSLEQISGLGYGATDFYQYASGEYWGADFTDGTLDNSQALSISTSHSASLTLSIGVFAQVTFLQLVNLAEQYTWDITDVVGLEQSPQTYLDVGVMQGTNGVTPPLAQLPSVVFELA
jgi:hypothetical protein